MNVFGDSGQIDSVKFLDYIARQLPADVKTLVQVRDELALRQGALSAVEDAAKLKVQAEDALTAARDKAAAIIADANAKLSEANKAKEFLDADVAEHNKVVAQFNADATAKWSDLASREKNVAMREADLKKSQDALAVKEAQLATDRAALDAKIKLMQEKIASLSV